MLIYRDIFSEDELCSDSFPMKIHDDVIYEFSGKHVTRTDGEVKLEGANASEEDPGDENYEAGSTSGIDIVLNHNLKPMEIYKDMKTFKDYIKEYMKKLADHLKKEGKSDDEITAWKKKMQTWVAAIMKKDRFKNLDFYVGNGENAADGQLVILEFREMEDGNEVPIVMLVKAGILEEKF